MKKTGILIVVLLHICAGALYAQNHQLFDALYKKMAASATAMEYSYSLNSSGLETLGNGTLLVQDDAYIMKGNGLEIYCDGSTVCAVDPEALEVVVDKASEEGDEYMANPALLFVHLNELFKVDSSVSNGEYVTVSLSPKVPAGITAASIVIKESSSIVTIHRALFTLSDGNELDIKIKSMNFSEKKPLTSFVYDISALDSNWLITDIR